MHRSKLVFGRYDYAAFLTFAAYASSSLVVPVVLVTMANDLHFPLADGGMAKGGVMQLVRSSAMCLSMAGCGFAAAKWGNRRIIGLAVAMMALGIFLCSIAPSFICALPLFMVAGLGEGIIEGLGTPFVQDLHDKDQGRYVNFTHGFWSLGVFFSVLLFGALVACGVSWRIVLALTSLLCVPSVFLLLCPEKKRPYIEKNHGNSSAEVVRSTVSICSEPRFWFFFAAMFFAGGGEYCLTFWCASFIQLNFACSALAGGIGTACFSAGMFFGRTCSGALVKQEYLQQLIIFTGVAAAAVSALIPPFAIHLAAFPNWSLLPIIYALLFFSGLGTAPFWPSIQSLAVFNMPQFDSTMMFILLSCAGVPGCGILTWLMGLIGDIAGLAGSFFIVPVCFLIMALLVFVGCRCRKRL